MCKVEAKTMATVTRLTKYTCTKKRSFCPTCLPILERNPLVRVGSETTYRAVDYAYFGIVVACSAVPLNTCGCAIVAGSTWCAEAGQGNTVKLVSPEMKKQKDVVAMKNTKR